jgi:CubicO group peptidase (beta-lactamase class C family)
MKKILLSMALLLLTASCFRHVTKLPKSSVSDNLDQIESQLFNGLLLEKSDGNFMFAKLTERMKEARVPGVAYAVIQDNQVYAARTHGLARSKPAAGLNENILFNAGSVSKTATGLLCARLHELGKIDLDKSINEYFKKYNIDFRLNAGIKITEKDLIDTKNKISKEKAAELFQTLKNYQVITEDNYFSLGHPPKEQVPSELLAYHDFFINKNNELRKKSTIEVDRSLRQILSHSAGISVSGLPGYFIKEAPTKFELLMGTKKGLIPVIEVVYDPYEGEIASINAKTKSHYAGGGYILIEILLEKMFGQTFEAITDTYLFRELGMTKSTFEQTATNHVAINGINYSKAEGYDEQGQPTNYGTKVFPAKSMAGLWTTPSDIAKMAIALNNSLRGVKGAYLSQKMAAEVLLGAGQKAGNQGAGLGVFSTDEEFSHGGFNPGFGTHYVINRDGSGFVRMLNGSNSFGLGQELYNAFQFMLGKAKNLTKYHIDQNAQDLTKLTGNYQGREFKLSIELKDKQLFATLFQKGRSEPFEGSSFAIYPIIGGKFAANTVLPFPIYFKFSEGTVVVEHKEWPDMEGSYQKIMADAR